MSNSHHHTQPFRRPVSTWCGDSVSHPCDPADMGADYGMELCLAAQSPHADASKVNAEGGAAGLSASSKDAGA
jgi:hypothetical protein